MINYFRSSLAHNTVCINNQNHAEQYGYNHWKNKKNITGKITDYIEDEEKVEFASACIFPDGALHKRKIEIYKKNFSLSIIDVVDCKGKKFSADILFHLPPNLAYDYTKKEIVINKRQKLKFNTSLKFDIFKGCLKPRVIGWYSPEFSELMLTQSLISSHSGSGTATYTIQFNLS